MPKYRKLKRWSILISPTGRTTLLTNEAGPRDTVAAGHESSVHWTIEQFHRERKQLTRVQACQYQAGPQPAKSHRAGRTRLNPAQISHLPHPVNGLTTQTRVLTVYMQHELMPPTLAFT